MVEIISETFLQWQKFNENRRSPEEIILRLNTIHEALYTRYKNNIRRWETAHAPCRQWQIRNVFGLAPGQKCGVLIDGIVLTDL